MGIFILSSITLAFSLSNLASAKWMFERARTSFCRTVAVVSSPDRLLARDFIQRTREEILQRKTALCELVMTD